MSGRGSGQAIATRRQTASAPEIRVAVSFHAQRPPGLPPARLRRIERALSRALFAGRAEPVRSIHRIRRPGLERGRNGRRNDPHRQDCPCDNGWHLSHWGAACVRVHADAGPPDPKGRQSRPVCPDAGPRAQAVYRPRIPDSERRPAHRGRWFLARRARCAGRGTRIPSGFRRACDPVAIDLVG